MSKLTGMKKTSLIAAFGILVGLNLHAATLIRGFEDRSQGAFTTQYDEFTITTDTADATLEVYSFAQYAVEGTQFLTIQVPPNLGSIGNGIFTANAGYELLGISFNGIEATSGTTVANVSLFTSTGVNLAILNVIAPGSGSTPVTMDFSSYGSIGRFEVRNITDGGGFAYDRVVVNAVPEPSALSLLAVGLGGLAMLRRRLEDAE